MRTYYTHSDRFYTCAMCAVNPVRNSITGNNGVQKKQISNGLNINSSPITRGQVLKG
jgi:hypothetical protein